MNNQTGQCLCGSMHYEISADPVMLANCHCTHCQKASGSAFSSNTVVPAEAFKITGDTLTTYLDHGDSGLELRRYFCSRCGSPLYTEADAMPGLTIVKAGTLDDTSSYKPTADIWCASKMDWLKQGVETAEFEQMPPSK
tara:strand:+ start:99787 stop:100203 length:417 start_codon:yes stop_codon:yes gene_type:complete